MKIEKIKPIPKYILKRIEREDKKRMRLYDKSDRFYSYLTKNDGELIRVVVAVKTYKGKNYYKQCIIHGIHSDKCFLKDIMWNYLSGYKVGWYAEGIKRRPAWYEDNQWGWNDDKYFNFYSPIVNLEYIDKFKEYQYSACKQTTMDLFKYLRLYEQYPQVEYLTKLDLHTLAGSKQILRLIEKDKSFAKWIIRNKDRLKYRYYYKDIIIKAYKTNIDIDVLQQEKRHLLEVVHTERFKQLRKDFDLKTCKKIVQYIYKQDISLSMYIDYFKACKYLHLDLTEDKNLLPHNFNRWHDIRIDEYKTAKAEADEKERKDLYDKFRSVAEKYINLQFDKKGDYVVIIAKSPRELMNEGNILHHCVGHMGYDQKFVREDSLIFFVRTKEEPNTPYITVEYSPRTKKILQYHGVYNSAPNEETKKYIDKVWLPYANKQIRQLAA